MSWILQLTVVKLTKYTEETIPGAESTGDCASGSMKIKQLFLKVPTIPIQLFLQSNFKNMLEKKLSLSLHL